MPAWNHRRWLAAVLATAGTAMALGLPTGIIPNPVVSIGESGPWWSGLSLTAVSILSGLLLASYLVPASGASGRGTRRRAGLSAAAGLYVTICPTCTVIAGVALGTGGVVTWLQPAQPFLAVGAIALLGVALYRRVRTEGRCRSTP